MFISEEDLKSEGDIRFVRLILQKKVIITFMLYSDATLTSSVNISERRRGAGVCSGTRPCCWLVTISTVTPAWTGAALAWLTCQVQAVTLSEIWFHWRLIHPCFPLFNALDRKNWKLEGVANLCYWLNNIKCCPKKCPQKPSDMR